ncbi:MAG: hypothetical protein ACRC1H_08970 [Caldilineaceae bacterium]
MGITRARTTVTPEAATASTPTTIRVRPATRRQLNDVRRGLTRGAASRSKSSLKRHSAVNASSSSVASGESA